MRVSILIPCKEINNYIRESISYILKLNFQDFEILLLPDEEQQENFSKTKIIPTGPVGPAQKRDLAISFAQGEILAFLDDDAYPRVDWLKNALIHFLDQQIAAVGGPAITPETDSFAQKISGAAFLSKFSGGNPERYWPVGKIRNIDDWPSVNLIVRKSDFLSVGGFDSKYWPGEDTQLCLNLIKKLNKKIIYDPSVLVYHHRRPGLLNHLKQIGGYGLHRGFFAKKMPETSFRLKYFIPSVFFIFAVLGWILLFLPFLFKMAYIIVWLAYLLALVISAADIYSKMKDFKVALAAIPYIFLTHIYYGLRFILGFIFIKNLDSQLRK